MTFRNGLDSLSLRPEDSVLVLIDHQPYQLANLNSHDPHMVVNNTTALAKGAKVFGVPTILTSVVAARGGDIFPHVTEVFPGQEVIDRTTINTWEDPKVVDAVKATGRKQLIMAGLWTEICVAMPAIQAAGEGWDVTVITDASGGTSVEAHEVAIQRMIAGGINMMTWLALASEWQRDWARAETATALNDALRNHLSAAAPSPICGSSSCSTRRCRASPPDPRAGMFLVSPTLRYWMPGNIVRLGFAQWPLSHRQPPKVRAGARTNPSPFLASLRPRTSGWAELDRRRHARRGIDGAGSSGRSPTMSTIMTETTTRPACRPAHVPWNKGRLIGQRPPLKVREV
jgi:nicotinamidase-related amidase